MNNWNAVNRIWYVPYRKVGTEKTEYAYFREQVDAIRFTRTEWVGYRTGLVYNDLITNGKSPEQLEAWFNGTQKFVSKLKKVKKPKK